MILRLLWLFGILGAASCIQPGDVIKGHTYSTLNGDFYAAKDVIVICLDREDADSRNMFLDLMSVRGYWKHAPEEISYLFIAQDGENATASALWMRDRLMDPSSTFNVTEDRIQQLQPQLFFSTDVLSRAGGWLFHVLNEWRTPRRLMHACILENSLKHSFIHNDHGSLMNEAEASRCFLSTRLDADYSWIPWPMTGISGPLHWTETLPKVNDIKLPQKRRLLNGSIALLALDEIEVGVQKGTSRLAHILEQVQEAGAIAVIVVGPAEQDLFPLTCGSRSECNVIISIPVTMIPWELGIKLKRALLEGCEVAVNATEHFRVGTHVGVDASGRLFEVGWLKYPTLAHATWAAQWQLYLKALETRLRGDKGVVIVPIFDGQSDMAGEHGIRKMVELPKELWQFPSSSVSNKNVVAGTGAESFLRYSRLELDMELGCPGSADEDCPQWDHMVQLFVCCEKHSGTVPSCDPCPTTLWDPLHGDLRKTAVVDDQHSSSPICGRELGRWATPFRRRVGRWVTDASHFLPLFHSPNCSLTVQSAPWAGTWRPSLRLRFSGQDSLRKTKARFIPLPFHGGKFDAAYNSRFDAFQFSTPWHLQRAVVVILITGHGSDENDCAEFCPTSHHMQVNGQEHSLVYTEAGTPWGCADRVLEGVVPNQHGTWMYGRNGWCDGQDVKPWVLDITADLAPPGAAVNNTLQYFTLYKGREPAPVGQPGYIMMSSNLLLYVEDAEATSDLEAPV